MSANIEALVKKHIAQYRLSPPGSAAKIIRNALTEQAEAFKGELQAYDGMVRELTKTVEDMRAAQSVPVVGEVVGWRWVDASGKPEGVCIFTGQPSGGAIRKAYELGYTHEFVIAKPTHSITAAELTTLREKAAMADELRKDAERYRWLRMKGAHSDAVDKVHMFGPQLDRAIDAAIAQGKGE